MRRAFDPLVTFVLTFAAYAFAAQRTMYGVDGWWLLRRLSGGDVRSDMHLAFKSLAWLGGRVGQSLGLSLHDASVLTCGFCTALGVALIHAATRRLGAGRAAAFVVAFGVAVTPGVAFYATVFERHGVFMLGVGVAAFASAGLAVRPDRRAALGTAAAFVLAYALHSTGVALCAVFLPLALAIAHQRIPGASWTRLAGWGVLVCVLTAAGAFAARKLGVAVGIVRDEGASFAFFLEHARFHVVHPEMVAGSIWNEFLLPFMPFALSWVFAFRTASLRAAGLATSIGILAYSLLSFLVLGDFGEHGAYALPLAWPLVWLTQQALGTRATAALGVVALALAAVAIHRQDDRHLAAVATGVRELAAPGRPFLLPAAPEDFELIYLELPELRPNDDFWDAFDAQRFPVATLRDNAAVLTGWLAQKAVAGRVLLMTTAGRAELTKPLSEAEAGLLVLRTLEDAFEFTPASAGGFHGYRLDPRR